MISISFIIALYDMSKATDVDRKVEECLYMKLYFIQAHFFMALFS